MRQAVFFFVALLFLLPAALFAADKFDPKAVTGSGDICLNEKVVISGGKPVFEPGSTNTERYKTCKNISGGCTFAKEKTDPPQCACGRVVIAPPEGKAITLDKCDPNYRKNFEKAMAGGAAGMSLYAAQALISQRIQDVDVSTQTGRDQLSQILQNYGLSEEEADAKVSDPKKAEAVQTQLQKLVDAPDAAEASKVADQLGFRLNKDLTDEVRLDPEKYAAVLTDEELARAERRVENTFQEVVKGVVADNLAPLCAQLGGCSDTACLSSGSLTCRTNNPGALTWAPWEAKYGGQPCGQNNNTACFPSVEHGLAAKIELLTGPRYLGGDNNTILKLLCNGYATEAAGNNCNSYATFVQNQTGIPMNQTIDPRDPEQVGKITMAMARLENGRFVPFTPQQLESAMALVYGGKLPNGTPGFIPQMAYGTGGGTRFGSPFNFGTTVTPATVGYGSAFGYGAPPAPTMQTAYSQAQQTAPTSDTATQRPAVAPQPRPPIATSTAAEELARAIQDPSAVNAANRLVNIVVEQTEITRGESVQVSWTSIDMSTDKPCELRVGSKIIARKNQGTAIVGTSAATRVGSLVFYLRCTTASGTTFQRTAATMVR